MKNIEGRLGKLEREAGLPKQAVYFWDDGNGLTPSDEALAAEAQARGDEFTIWSWGSDDAEALDRGN